MRYLVCLIVGLAIGAIVASMTVNAFARRDAWPRGLMNVMQHELVDARAAARSGQCAAPATRNSAAHLQLIADDLERALLAPGTKDRVLSQYASDFRAAVAQWDSSADCARQTAALTTVANACDACHRDYR
ncbi:hypothetical protein [Dokdonella soli]|uniref:Cytochrome c n=1 Tax=Dokdonella soli TaxID=529810 RepID=A0ABP3TKY0_9GAMM